MRVQRVHVLANGLDLAVADSEDADAEVLVAMPVTSRRTEPGA
jgi:hypothetical protein